MAEDIAPFRIEIPDADLVDVRERLARTRWPREIGDNSGWQVGANLAFMRELTGYWLDGYDWRAEERRMNAFPQFRTTIDDVPIHFLHVRGKGPNPTPLILNHGWPWTFWDMRKIIEPLSDPAAFGGDPADAFDIVVPSLPGFGFSAPLDKPGVNFFNTADLWLKLMERLGYHRFGTQGGDFGAMVSAVLGHKFPDRIIGAHLHFIAAFKPPFPEPADFTPQDYAWGLKTQTFMEQGAGYMAVQRTRPQSLAFAMNDSPVGLAAWLVEKRHAWADCREGFETVFSKDDLITSTMIYWLTETFGSSARYYFEAGNGDGPVHDRLPVVEAPVGVLQFEHDVMPQPRKWAEKYYNLQSWKTMDKGGHFAPIEAPDALVDDVRAFFRTLRA
ncbi:epoxide hydrolase family protein [Sphingomonas bacterium]|uniref:epoxide hydrolase family protein n=1 Tax=Sphingomonas bacterium TaxID=1895847 RepID=UPI001575AAD3|nr:epoxide hydrolase family protein [Sphingomonas bacterium]